MKFMLWGDGKMKLNLKKLKSKTCIILVAAVVVLIGIFYVIFSYLQDQAQISQQTQEITETVGEPSEGFQKRVYIYFSKADDTNFYYRFSQKNQTLERVKRQNGEPDGEKIQFTEVETVISNDVYELTIIKGTKNKEELPQIYFCNFQTGECQKSKLEIINLALSPNSSFALIQLFEKDKVIFAQLDLKDASYRKILDFDSFEYNFNYLEASKAILQPRATSPDEGCAISIIDLSKKTMEEIVDEAGDYILSPQKSYLIYQKFGDPKMYLRNLDKGSESELSLTNTQAYFFGQDDKNLYLLNEKENKIEILELDTEDFSKDPQKIKELSFSKDDMITDVIWLNNKTYLILTKNGYEQEISL